MKTTAVVAVVLAASLALAGCSLTPTGGSTGGGTAGGGQSGPSDGSDTSTETDTSDTTDNGLDGYKGLPDTFPSDEVPLIEGDVAFGIDLGTGWSVVIPVPDLTSAYQEASAKLTGAGFTAEVEQTAADGSIGVFTNDRYQINVTAGDTPDYGTAVSYVVVSLG